MAYGLRYRNVRCASCGHFIRRGVQCPYCGDADVTANIRETGLERLVGRVEENWNGLNRALRIALILALLALIFGGLYFGFSWNLPNFR